MSGKKEKKNRFIVLNILVLFVYPFMLSASARQSVCHVRCLLLLLFHSLSCSRPRSVSLAPAPFSVSLAPLRLSLSPSVLSPDRSLAPSPRFPSPLLAQRQFHSDNFPCMGCHVFSSRPRLFSGRRFGEPRAVDFVRHARPPTRLWTHATSKSIAEWITLRGPIRTYCMPDPPVSRIGRGRGSGRREDRKEEEEGERGWAST